MQQDAIHGMTLVVAAVVLLSGGMARAAPILLGPQEYLSLADSPFLGAPDFAVEDLEDNAFDLLGVTPSAGTVVGPGGLTDSVDGDDGVIDGSGTNGHSFYYTPGSSAITFTLDAAVIGFVPQRVGLVWTDGAGTITFEAFDTDGISLGTVTGDHADDAWAGTTSEDRFYGIEYTSGIGSISIHNSVSRIEVDHIQYALIPEPSTLGLLMPLALIALRRRLWA